MKKLILLLVLLTVKLNAQVAASLQLAGGDNAWHASHATAVPLVRQMVLNTTTGQYKIGDGVTQLQNLTYYPANTQSQLNGTGFVKATGTVVTYDNSTYAPTSSLSLYVPYSGATGSVNLGANTFSTGSNIVASGTGSIGSTFTVGGISSLSGYSSTANSTITVNQNSRTSLKVSNSTAGSAAAAGIVLTNNIASNEIFSAATTMAAYRSNALNFAGFAGSGFAWLNGSANGIAAMSDAGAFAINNGTNTISGATLGVIGTMSVSSTATLNGLTNGAYTGVGVFSQTGFSTFQRSLDANVANISINSGVANTNAFQLATDQPNNLVIFNSRNSYSTALAINDVNKVFLSSSGLSVTPTSTLNGLQLASGGFSVTTKGIDVTAGDAATINSPVGRFRKDNSGAVFTLTNSQITANSIIVLTAANAAIDATATGWTVSAGAGSATITFNAAPTANFDMNFMIMN